LELHKFAAIDIGTNAVRLLFSNVIEEEDNATFKKNSLIRVPIRLGEDVFNGGLIRPAKINQLIDAMIAFRHLINIHQVERYRACATSAMREAENGQKVVELVKEKAGLDIEIIDGATEAEIIYENKIADIVNDNKNYLYVDIGGGSTEITLFQQGIPIRSHSFNIGTIRLLNKQVTKEEKKHMKHWLRELAEEHPNITVIGSGGNVNKLFKLSRYKEQQVIPYKVIKKLYEEIKSHSYEERIKDLGMNPDRADVIIPASKLFLKIMKWANTQEAIIPKIGIADGIVRRLYADYRNERKQVPTTV
jgi:exopolyphosphatase/guanosine-5'-triphosphate,3'-diphosphate pyrophosphatase